MTYLVLCRDASTGTEMRETENQIRIRHRIAIFIGIILRAILPRNEWGDFLYSLCLFRRGQGRFPDLGSPKFYSDHLFKMRTDGSFFDPLRQFVSDKEYVKYYVGAVAGWQYTIETYNVLHSPDDVDNLELKQFPCVLKPTHACGPVAFMMNESQSIDHEELKTWFDIDYYQDSREQNYKFLRPKIIVEEFFSEDGNTVPRDFKIFCSYGVPMIVQVDSDRFTGVKRVLYDPNWRRLPVSVKYPAHTMDVPRPPQLEEMLDVAAQLSRPFSFIRVDIYADDSRVKVGELTNSPGGGTVPVIPPSGELILGELFERDRKCGDAIRPHYYKLTK